MRSNLSPLLIAAASLLAGCRSGEPAVLVAFSVHLEGWNLDADPVVKDYLREIDETAAAFEAYDGRLTLEAGMLIPRAVQLGDDTLAELAGRGHAVGVHADMSLGGDEQPYDELVSALEGFRGLLLDQGIDAGHVSGVCSDVDWVGAAVEAGLPVVSGATLWCARSLEPSLQPPELADCAAPVDCHWPWPGDFEARLRPWRMGGGDDWILSDPAGPAVMVPTTTGLTCNEEVAADPSATECELSEADIDLWFEHLDAAVEAAEEGQLTVLKGTISVGPELEPELLEGMLKRLRPYLRRGHAGWATVPEIVTRFEEQE